MSLSTAVESNAGPSQDVMTRPRGLGQRQLNKLHLCAAFQRAAHQERLP